MQCITLRSSCVAPVCASRRSQRQMVVRASIGDDVLKTFSPSKDNKQPKSGGSGFSASPKHHGGREPGRQSSHKPFADGYQKGGQVKLTKEQAEAQAAAQKQQEEEGDGVAEYLGEAAQKLVNANFEKEKGNTTGSAGWKGDIHDRKKEGFHTRKV